MRILFIMSIAFLSCTNNNTQEKIIGKEDSLVVSKKNKIYDIEGKSSTGNNLSGCYWQILKRDTLVASLSQKDEMVTGKLSFDNFEKDGSSGLVRGTKAGDIIKLWYSFESEGMKSVMEVWFKKQGDALLRGTGDMATKADSSYFTNPAAVEFTSNQQMKKVDCNEVPSKYK